LRLREITPKQQSVYKALMALILCHGAQDFYGAPRVCVEVIGVAG